MSRKLSVKQFALGLTMFGIASGLLYWCLRQIDFATFWRELARASFLPLVAAMGAVYCVLLINTFQWQLFLPKNHSLSYRRLFGVIRVMAMMANILPWGKAFALYHLGQIEKVGKTVALSVLTVDQVIEGFSKLAVCWLVAWLTPIPDWMKTGVQVSVIAVVVSYLGLLFIAHWHREFEERHPHELDSVWHRFAHFVSKWAHHMAVLRDYKKTALAMIVGLLMKLFEVGAVYLVQRAFGLDLPPWAPFFIVAAYNLTTMVPITPGNLGIFEATAFFVYKYMGVEPTQAMSLAVFNHIVYLVPMVVPGYLVSMQMGLKLSQAVFRQDSAEDLMEERTL